MKLPEFPVSRRGLLVSAAGAGLFWRPCLAQPAPPAAGQAPALPDPSLHSAAITVRNPSKVLLQAITRAGARLVAVGEHGVIIYSDDNGVTWAQARVPVDLTFTCVAFATPQIGWAAGHFGVIAVTGDGGATWRIQLTGLQANQLTMAAAQAAVAANDKSAGAPLAMRRAQNFTASGPSRPFLCILVLDPRTVIVFGAYRMTVMSTDAGATWVDWSLHIEDRLSHNLYDGTIAGSGIYLVGETGLVFYSDASAQDFVPTTSPGPITLFGVIAAADASVIVFGVAGNAFRSADGGKTWQAVSFATGDNLVAGRQLPSGTILVASESGSLFKSTDHGVTFQIIPGVPPTAIFDFIQAADNSLILVGISGVLRLPVSILDS